MQRRLAEQALSRAAGAPLVLGNRVRLLRDATENYPAWLEAIAAARRHIFFESYIFADDEIGRTFVDALEQRARQGVKVRVLYDWLGTSRQPEAVGRPARRRRRGAGLQPAPPRQPLRLDLARPPQDHRHRRPGRVRQRPVRERALAGQPQAGRRALARHRHRDPRARRWPTWRTPSPGSGPPLARRWPTRS